MDRVQRTLRDFASYYTDYIPEIPVVHHVPTAIEFYSDYVITNRPFVISCPENHLPAVERWNEKPLVLEDKLKPKSFPVFVRPTFQKGEVEDDRFYLPEVRSMTCWELFNYHNYPLKMLNIGEFYYVKQPNNLEEYPQIAEDVRKDVPWATEALGSGPIAANFSVENEGNVTLMHKDEYDNFFYVLRGTRRFKLIPPIAHVCIPYKKYKKFQWFKNKGERVWRPKDLNEEIELISCESEPDTLEKSGFYRNIKSYVVDVQCGDALYIPALWYHGYHELDYCLALNYCYDMKWDWKFPLLRFLSKIFKLKKPTMYADVSVGTQTELEKDLYFELLDEITEQRLNANPWG